MEKPTQAQITAYVQGSLSENEQQAVELYFFEHPEALDAIEAEIALRDVVKSNAPVFESPNTPVSGGFFNQLAALFTLPRLSIAGATAMVLIAAVVILNRPDVILEVSGEVELGQLRGSQQIPSIGLPSDGLVRLRIDLGSLSRPVTGELVGDGRVHKLAIPQSAERIVLVDLPATSLVATRYEVILLDAQGQNRTYSFQLN